MDIKSISMSGVFLFKEQVRLDLPRTGLVLVTGFNGAGKSALVEATPIALWGRTLRGTKPWRDGESGSVAIETWDGLRATRTKKASGSGGLTWAVGEDTTKWENNTKAQSALEARVGSFEVYRRARVFSSGDAAHFSLASDSERKKLIEIMLGFMRFDPALVACRADLKRLREQAAKKESERLSATTRLEGEERRLLEATEGLKLIGSAADVKSLESKESKLKARIRELGNEISAVRDRIRVLKDAGAPHRVRAAEASRAANRIRDGLCPTCEQPAGHIAAKHLQEAQAASASAESAEAAARLALTGLESSIAELEEDRAICEERYENAKADLAAARQNEGQRQRFTRIVEDSTKTAELLRSAQTAAADQWSSLQTELAEIDAAETVLGLRGVRAQLLGRALSGMETIANYWLERIAGPGLKAVIRPYTENQDGGVRDSISMNVEGAGGGQGYHGASQGQRRRIDLAIMFALSDLAQSAQGSTPGTLWFDECVDSLDEAGTIGVCEAIADMSKDRCVVVISHSSEIQSQLPVAAHVRVETELGSDGMPARSWLT